MKKLNSNYKVLAHFAVLVLALLIAVASTTSWYDRTEKQEQTGNALSYNPSGLSVSYGKGLEVTTYQAIDDNGILIYDESEFDYSNSITVSNGEVCCFKTVIKNTENNGASLVSLYLPSISIQGINIGIIGPEKTYKQYDTTSCLCIEDNIFVETGVDEIVEVYWFIDPIESNDVTFTIGKPYIVNN